MQGEETANLLRRAAEGDQDAWAALVDEFSSLVWSVIRGFRLDPDTSADVAQTVWLRLAEKCTNIREPERLAGWLSRTAWNEALLMSKRSKRTVPSDRLGDDQDRSLQGPEEQVLDFEIRHEVRMSFQQLGDSCRRLLELLCQDPPLAYAEMAVVLDMPIGSIGSTRGRCLDKLRVILGEGNA
jgi:RNA polymerase sigma factor (sigma-70 family)